MSRTSSDKPTAHHVPDAQLVIGDKSNSQRCDACRCEVREGKPAAVLTIYTDLDLHMSVVLCRMCIIALHRVTQGVQ